MNWLLELDGNILLWIQENVRNDFLTPVFRFITTLGDEGYVWIGLAVLFLFFKKYRNTSWMMALSLIGSLVINNWIIKNIVARPRPYTVLDNLTILIERPGEFSFPSGHTSSSFAAAVVIFLTCPRKIGIPAMILAFLIAISRNYVGVHYPTDVLAGMVTGTLIAFGAVKLYEFLVKKFKKA